MEEPKVLGPGEVETVRGPYGTYERYYLSDEELQKYRELPQDTFWDHNSKPHNAPVRKTKGA
ncbi:hypothetical protein KDC22_14295 [Paenibacillus tritici]|uniref:hypothetical protein n=1 Tax=Paenibacillus tritici TaxID=1873425 RepID=UPI001BA758DB|nr:hypothetical protein [Paenibacillus tritici]QUL57537.1 hypothetical protein KDC22_14295 [Paenibacillus tritici]